jgi:hypothetical protein
MPSCCNLSLNTNSATYQATVGLNQGTTSVAVTNNGSISSNGTGTLNVSTALSVVSTSGNIAIDNSGILSASGPFVANTLSAQSASGDIHINNEQTGQITSGNSGFDVYAVTAGAGTIVVTNNGLLNASQQGIVAQGDTGSLAITNSGTVNVGTADGIMGTTNSGPITIVNNGAITGTNSNYGILASNSLPDSSAISVTNAGQISGVSNGIGAYQNGTTPLTIANSGSITSSSSGIYGSSQGTASSFYVKNTGNITSSASGIYLFSPAVVFNTGSIAAPTAISVPDGSFVVLAGSSPITGTIQGGLTAASTSELIFALSIPANQLHATESQLNAEIATYQGQLGGQLTFTINGVSYNISNFDPAIINALQPLYSAVPGFQSLGAVLDNLSGSNPQATAILSALANVPDASVAAALAELSPGELAVFRNVAFDNNTFNVSQLNNHLANLRDNLTGFDSGALSIRDSSMDPSLNQIHSRLLAFNPAPTPGLMSDSVDTMFGGVDMKDMKSTTVNT